MIHVFSVDVGYGYVKAVGLLGPVRFQSVVGTYNPGRMQLSEQNRFTLTLGDTTYMVGQTALDESRAIDYRTDVDYLETTTWEVLWKFAFTETFPPGEYQVFLVSGLPVAHYLLRREAMATRFNGLHHFTREGQAYTVNVLHTQVLEQPYGGVMAYLLDGEGRVDSPHAPGHVAYVDVGGQTTNYIGVRRMVELDRESGTDDSGIWSVAHRLLEDLRQTYPKKTWAPHEAMRALETRQVHYFKPENIAPLVEKHLAPLRASVLARMAQYWGAGADLDALILGGGGMRVLGQEIQNVYPLAEILETPEMANVTGYWRFGQRALPKVQEKYHA